MIPLRPAYRLTRGLHDRFADWRLGITTRDKLIMREARLSEVLEKQQRCPHRAVHYGVARRAMRLIAPTPADTLLDLGCGSGRLICLAAQFAFSRVVGVELNPSLAVIAVRNVRALRGYTVRPEVVCADAATFEVPDDVTVVWMFNPFKGDVFRASLMRITESYDRRPRRMRLVYYNPREHDIVASAGRFRQVKAHPVWWWRSADNRRFRMINVYEVVAA
jgi:SAM-dependent methyltransferase